MLFYIITIRFVSYIFQSIIICTTIMPSFNSAITSAIMAVFNIQLLIIPFMHNFVCYAGYYPAFHIFVYVFECFYSYEKEATLLKHSKGFIGFCLKFYPCDSFISFRITIRTNTGNIPYIFAFSSPCFKNGSPPPLNCAFHLSRNSAYLG